MPVESVTAVKFPFESPFSWALSATAVGASASETAVPDLTVYFFPVDRLMSVKVPFESPFSCTVSAIVSGASASETADPDFTVYVSPVAGRTTPVKWLLSSWSNATLLAVDPSSLMTDVNGFSSVFAPGVKLPSSSFDISWTPLM